MPRSSVENYRLEFRTYRRKFLRPLVTAHGRWTWREGVIVRLIDAKGHVGYGESAPTPGFSTEVVTQDLTWLRKQGRQVAGIKIQRIPQELACLRWALSCAQAMINGSLPVPKKTKSLPIAALLPAGSEALEVLPLRVKEGYRVFKWKVGVKSPNVEIALLNQLLPLLPTDGKLRLDANGGLTMGEWKIWCAALKALGAKSKAIEFFEQPGMFRLNNPAWTKLSPIPVALDESVTGPSAQKNKLLQKWLGPLVVKFSLWGDLNEFLRWRRQAKADLVYSSVFETSIGLNVLLNLAATDVNARQRALGLGNLNAFANDGLQLHAHVAGPRIASSKLSENDFLKIWNCLEKTN